MDANTPQIESSQEKPKSSPSERARHYKDPAPQRTFTTRVIAWAGLVFIGIGACALVAMIWLIWSNPLTVPVSGSGRESTEQLATQLTKPMVLFFAAGLSSLIGYMLLRSAGAAERRVIPWEDYEILEELLMNNNQSGINNYIRLSSLSGFGGIFTKLGLSGLPLATIGLTILFVALGLLVPNHSKELFDFTKLTLGAFIGSFVQRAASERREEPQTQTPS